MPTAAIIGASRGIGLEFVRQYAGDGWRVHATTRTPDVPGELGELKGDVRLHHLDVRNDTHIARLADELSKTAIDVLVHNAGVLNSRGRASPEEVADTMRINAEAPIVTVSALLDSVAASEQKKVAIISSIQGSGRPRPQSPDLYGDSKGELNRRFRDIEPEWRARGITAVALHPGYVRTDMTGPHASISPEESVTGIRALLDNLAPADSGSFLDYRGKEVAW
ncbi:MAG: SDR family oxidoreductase [Alphaproteobacteria bacterium]|nr:SDR family oxidoreductase [Alphaproteobacteria bacterium]